MNRPKKIARPRAKQRRGSSVQARPRQVWNALRSFRAANATLGRRAEELEEVLRTLRGVVRKEALRELLSRLASSDTGELLNELDRIRHISTEESDTLCRALRNAREAIDGLFEVLSQETGLAPVAVVGSELELSRADIDRYEILGGALKSGHARIRAVVEAPGWRMGTQVLQRPRVRSTERNSAE